MAGQEGRGRRGQRRHGRAVRPIAWSTLFGATAAAAAAAFASPAYADPALPNTVPDSGARPVPAGTITLPGSAPTTGSTVPAPSLVGGPLAQRIYTSETELGLLSDQLLALQQQRDQALADVSVAENNLRMMRDALTRAQESADAAAGEALKEAAALPPGEFGSDLHELDALSQLMQGQSAPRAEAAAVEVTRAQVAEQNANSYYLAMQAKAQTVLGQYGQLDRTRQTKEAALIKLRQDNADALAEIDRAQEAIDQQLGANYISGEAISGKAADPRALGAVRYALDQLGDRYLWAAEGPDRFDCSGLMWAAYRSPAAGGYTLPRVSRDQYWGTKNKTVSRSAMLPGDLLFFASGSTWTSIHHVGMYLGGGMMVHSPTTNDVVKVSSVWWSRLYATTRVYDAVGSPTSTAPPTPKPTTPKPTTPKPTPPKPTPPKPTTSAKPTTSPSPTGSPTPSPSGSPTPSPSGSPTPSPSGSPSPEPSDSAAPAPTDSASPDTEEPSKEPSSPAATDSASPSARETAPPVEESASAGPTPSGS
jgi:peptidoglycan DL-endopeptidase CwlO